MKRSIMLIAMLIVMISWSFAQGTGEIWGKVVDSETGNSIPGVNVVIRAGNTLLGAQTDVNGNFRLKGLAPGTYNLEFSFVGYGTGTLEKITVYADGYISTEDFALKPGVELTGAVIYSERTVGLIIPKKMNYQDIKDIPGKQDIKKIITLISPDVQKTEDGEMYFRGARSGDYVYYVDGIKVNAENFAIPTTAIGSMQVYTGGVPARYGDFTGGCVVIETQSYFDWLNSRN
jgi:hypothetical protein